MGGSRSSASTTTTTTSAVDSYNKSAYLTSNQSDVGNIKLDLGMGDGDLPSINTLLPLAVVGIVGALALVVLNRR